MAKTATVYCPYCGERAALVDSSVIYKSSYGMMWLCQPCDAYTGVHKSSPSFKPLGTLAKKELRELRKKVHYLFDPLWQKGRMTRSEAYYMLSKLVDVDLKKCHVAMFDEAMCKKAIKELNTPI